MSQMKMENEWKSGLKKALSNSRIFGDSSEDLLRDIMSAVEIKNVLGGSVVFAQGDKSDSMLVLVSGRLTARLALADGTHKTLSEISPGTSAGELGLVLHKPRSASVIAVRDSCIAVLSRDRFDALLHKYPVDLNRAITRTLFEYNPALHRPVKHVSATVVTLVNLDRAGKTVNFGQLLATQMKKFGKVLLISRDANSGKGDDQQWSGVIHEMESDYDYILLETSNQDTAWSRLTSRQTDQLIFIASSDYDYNLKPVHSLFFEGSMSEKVRKSLVCIHPENTSIPTPNQTLPGNIKPSDIFPVRANNDADVSRLCRFVTDNAVGVVLGGGGARGMAHVGVLRALEEQGIPIDIVCGNSMGALIGAQYAVGTDTSQLIRNTQKFVANGEVPTLPLYSLLSGKKIEKNIKAMFGNHRLESMWRPFFCVSCNLSKAEIYVHETGELWQAVLASNSPAGILPPVIKDGNLLVDAALLDNVPVEAMRQRLRFGTVIAVDVDVNEDLLVDESIESFNLTKGVKSWISKDKQEGVPGILEILNRAGHLGGLARRKQAIPMANYYLQPPVSQFGLMAYKRGDEIAEMAYHYTVEQIKHWPVDELPSAD